MSETNPLHVINDRKTTCLQCEYAQNIKNETPAGWSIKKITTKSYCKLNKAPLLSSIKQDNYFCPLGHFDAINETFEQKINLNNQQGIEKHRSGWGFALDSLQPLHTIYDGVFFEGFLEKSHAWEIQSQYENGQIPYAQSWIGFLHNPHNMPRWFDYKNSPQSMLNRTVTQRSLRYCHGLFVLSQYQKEWLTTQVDVPVCNLIHPTEIPDIKFNFEKYLENKEKKIIQLGYWLRDLYAIQELPTDKFLKIWLIPNEYAKFMRDEIESRTKDTFKIKYGNYQDRAWVENLGYDYLLSQNIGFVKLYDVGACNSVIECIVRNTPILVNPLPAIVEYLGKDYPMYFNTLKEAAKKVESNQLIQETHEYLKQQDKYRFTQSYFRKSFMESEIYKAL